jgi:hypothetical protein
LIDRQNNSVVLAVVLAFRARNSAEAATSLGAYMYRT